MKKESVPNGGFFVFEMQVKKRTEPYRQVNTKPLTLEAAKQLARIGATEGKHDRAVTTNPRSRKAPFRILAQYEARTGENVTRLLRANKLPPGKIQRRTMRVVAAEVTEEPVRTERDAMGWRYDPVTGAPLHRAAEPQPDYSHGDNVDEDGSPLEDWDD